MTDSNNTNITAGIAIGGLTISIACLTVSVLQAANFIIDSVPELELQIVLIAGITTALIGSQFLARRILQLARSDNAGSTAALICCAFTVLVTEAVSIGTSTAAFDGALIFARSEQNATSPQAKRIQERIDRYNMQIEAINTDRKKMGADWFTGKKQSDGRLDRLDYKIKEAEKEIASIDDSISGKAFDGLESRTGVSQSDIATAFGFLMTAIPFSCNFAFGALASSQRRRVEVEAMENPAGKKNQRDLRVVA